MDAKVKAKKISILFAKWIIEKGYTIMFKDINKDGRIWANEFKLASYQDIERFTEDEIFEMFIDDEQLNLVD